MHLSMCVNILECIDIQYNQIAISKEGPIETLLTFLDTLLYIHPLNVILQAVKLT